MPNFQEDTSTRVRQILAMVSSTISELHRIEEELKKFLGEGHRAPLGETEPTWQEHPPKRLSRVALKKGTKRPAVLSLQKMLKLEVDGIFGDKTEQVVRQLQQAHGLKVDGIVGPKTWEIIMAASAIPPDLMYRIYEWVAWVECGTVQDAFGKAEPDIGDGAGANYGVIQYNARGSMERLLRNAGMDSLLSRYRSHDQSKVMDDLKRWMGSQAGIRAQIDDFHDHIYSPALAFVESLPGAGYVNLRHWERMVALVTDIHVQNGQVYSPYRIPDKTELRSLFDQHLRPMLVDPDKVWSSVETRLVDGDPRDVNEQACRAFLEALALDGTQPYRNMGIGLAIYRGLCSRKKYRARVVARKLTIVLGHGKVHGSKVNMYDDFGL